MEINNPKNKFDAQGRPLTIQGNTIIAFNYPDEEIYQLGLYVQEKMVKAGLDKKVSLLPPSSFHVTVLGVMDDKNRDSLSWPKDLPRDASIEEMNQYAKEAYKRVKLPGEIHMKVADITPKAIMLEVNDSLSKDNIFNYRTALAENLNFGQFDNQDVLFHMSIGYIIQELTEEEWSAFEEIKSQVAEKFLPIVFKLNKPELTRFDSMMAFEVIE